MELRTRIANKAGKYGIVWGREKEWSRQREGTHGIPFQSVHYFTLLSIYTMRGKGTEQDRQNLCLMGCNF